MSDYYERFIDAKTNEENLEIVFDMVKEEVVGAKEFIEYVFADDKYKDIDQRVFVMILNNDCSSIEYFQEMVPEDVLPNYKYILIDIESEIPIENISFPWSEDQYSSSRKLLANHYEFENKTIYPRIVQWDSYHPGIIKELRVGQIFDILKTKGFTHRQVTDYVYKHMVYMDEINPNTNEDSLVQYIHNTY